MIPGKSMGVGSARKKARQQKANGLFLLDPGGDLLSHTAARAVPSAQRGLTSVFGMGTGVTPSA
jgi:non-ribosomal peptide synthetase component E (peptide arylation enzyme)